MSIVNFFIDNIIIIYFIIILIAGLYFGGNNKSIKDYAIGDRNFSDLALFSTIIVTSISGSAILFDSSQVYKNGIAASCVIAGSIIANFLKAEIIAPRISRYHNQNIISVGEMMRLDYGKAGQVLTGISSFFLCAGFIAMQLKVLGTVFSYSLGVDANIAIFSSSFVIIFYTAFGGIKAVTFTDIIQFFTLMISIPMIANVSLTYADGYSGLYAALTTEKFSILNLSTKVKNNYLSLFILFSLPIFATPVTYQRMLMAKDVLQAKIAFRYAAYAMIIYVALATLIGFTCYALNPNLAPKIAFMYMIDHHMPAGIKAIALLGVIAMCMSTADSFINNSGVALVNDVLKPLNIIKSTNEKELIYTRIITFLTHMFLISIISIYAAKTKNLVTILLKMSMFWTPVVAPAIFMNLFGFKTSKLNLFIAVIIGITTTLLWDKFCLSHIYIINSILAGTVTNALSLIILEAINKTFIRRRVDA